MTDPLLERYKELLLKAHEDVKDETEWIGYNEDCEEVESKLNEKLEKYDRFCERVGFEIDGCQDDVDRVVQSCQKYNELIECFPMTSDIPTMEKYKNQEQQIKQLKEEKQSIEKQRDSIQRELSHEISMRDRDGNKYDETIQSLKSQLENARLKNFEQLDEVHALQRENEKSQELLRLLDETFDSSCNCSPCWIMRSKGKKKAMCVIENEKLKESISKMKDLIIEYEKYQDDWDGVKELHYKLKSILSEAEDE